MKKVIFCTFALLTVILVNGRVVNSSAETVLSENSISDSESRQAAPVVETSTPEFVRLVVMRLIYGLASTMGLEERLEGAFNGAFVPPNADEDFFGFGGLGDGDDGDSGGEEGLAAIFDDDGI